MTHEPLPLRSAMHRDVPNGSRLEIANAYAVGRLIDGQAIDDAPRCEHGKIDKHYDVPEDQWLDEGIWCKGAPELRDLLDALAEEER